MPVSSLASRMTARHRAGGAPKAGMGLLGMQERVVSLGGTLCFERRPEGGARLVATIPDPGPEP